MRRLAAAVSAGRTMAERVRTSMGPGLARYVRLACSLLRQSRIELSPRRAVMLVRNIAGVHAARLLVSGDANPSESAMMALRHSLPHRATGEPVKNASLLAAHKEAWKAAGADTDSPLHLLMAEPDPLRRALTAILCGSLGKRDFSTVVADCLAALPSGARHALASELFDSGAAGRLVAAVAEQAAEWCAVSAVSQNVSESVQSGSPRHRTWGRVVTRVAALDKADPPSRPHDVHARAFRPDGASHVFYGGIRNAAV